MNIENIIETHQRLEKELHFALSTMEKKDKIYEIRKQIIQNQAQCPHYSEKYNLSTEENICPYCGFRFTTNDLHQNELNWE